MALQGGRLVPLSLGSDQGDQEGPSGALQGRPRLETVPGPMWEKSLGGCGGIGCWDVGGFEGFFMVCGGF